ncbi:hypothetical protein HDV00_000120 [Rhizophlyctis rosea]|nr:hypothetical protein HDV00_000120 [Rhizophlyctis rosea]
MRTRENVWPGAGEWDCGEEFEEPEPSDVKELETEEEDPTPSRPLTNRRSSSLKSPVPPESPLSASESSVSEPELIWSSSSDGSDEEADITDGCCGVENDDEVSDSADVQGILRREWEEPEAKPFNVTFKAPSVEPPALTSDELNNAFNIDWSISL